MTPRHSQRRPSPFALQVRSQVRAKAYREAKARPKRQRATEKPQRRQAWWAEHMRMGSAVTTEPRPHVAIQDAVIVRLLQGPALQSELAPLSRNWGAMLHEVNKSLRLAGRHVVSEPVTVQSAHGLAMHVRRYRMVAW